MLFLENEILVKIAPSTVSPNEVKTPIKAYVNSAGYDLFANEANTILPNSRILINTGIRMSIP